MPVPAVARGRNLVERLANVGICAHVETVGETHVSIDTQRVVDGIRRRRPYDTLEILIRLPRLRITGVRAGSVGGRVNINVVSGKVPGAVQATRSNKSFSNGARSPGLNWLPRYRW